MLRREAPGVSGNVYNVGTGTDLTLREIAESVMRGVGFDGKLVFDASKPDGMPRKVLDISRMRALGWQPTHGLEEGIRLTYRWCLDNGVLEYAAAESK